MNAMSICAVFYYVIIDIQHNRVMIPSEVGMKLNRNWIWLVIIVAAILAIIFYPRVFKETPKVQKLHVAITNNPDGTGEVIIGRAKKSCWQTCDVELPLGSEPPVVTTNPPEEPYTAHLDWQCQGNEVPCTPLTSKGSEEYVVNVLFLDPKDPRNQRPVLGFLLRQYIR